VPVGTDLEQRLQSVLETIYLLFNEGYSASSGTAIIRYELCEEAIRLAEMIAMHPAFQSQSDVFALLSLMQLNASRFGARQDEEGNILTLENQHRSQWDYELMKKGYVNLDKSVGQHVSAYHILATISAYHCSAATYQTTDWQSILTLYDKLIQIDPSPIVSLNRAIALSKVNGVSKALIELRRIEEIPAMQANYLFYSTLASFQMELNQPDLAITNLLKAIQLAPLQSEKSMLGEQLRQCREI
jgi:RNA polymerase sigma-70 factor (ECF subfamily)